MLSERRRQQVAQGFLAGCLAAAIVLFIWSNNLFTRLRLQVSDIYFVSSPVSDSIVIVAMDDASFRQYGRAPSQWSRTVYADLIDILERAGTRVVAFDVLFSEETPDDATLAAAIRSARQSDTRLRTVVAAAGVPPTNPAVDLEGFPQATRFENAITPVHQLAEVVDYAGYVNTFPDVDGIVRRQPSLVQIGSDARVSWSLAIYLAYLRVPETALRQIITYGDGELHVAGTRSIHVDHLGFWQQNFFGPPSNSQKQTFPVFSLVDVLSGGVDPQVFAGKVVLVGLINSAGITDQYTVPSASRGQLMSGVEIQANAVETLIQNRPVRAQDQSMQAANIALLCIGSSVLYMQLRWYFKGLLWALLAALLAAGAFLAFEWNGVIVNLFDSALALTLPVVLTIGIDITNEINRRRQSEFLLQSVVQVSQQRLMLDKILPHIAADIDRIVPGAEIIMWRCDQGNDADPLEIYRYPATFSDDQVYLVQLAGRVSRTGEPVIERSLAVLPIAWQKRQIAVCAVRHSDGAIRARSVGLLQKMAEQVAPSLENAFLYTEIERQNAVRDAILTGSPAGIIVLGQDLVVSRLNRAFDTTFSIASDQFLNQPVMTLLEYIGLSPKSCREIEQAFEAGAAFRREITLRKRTFSLEAAPQESFNLWVLVLTEITYLIQLGQLKTYMIRMLSHDLGNPLSRILGYTQLLINDRDLYPGTHQEYLEYILKDGEDMDRIIADVLNLEELRSSEFTLMQVDLNRLTSDLTARFRPTMLLKNQTLTITTPDSPVLVRGNHRQLSQALMNLLNNANKYTPEGGCIHVELAVTDNNYAWLSVKDNGYGIPESAHAKMFTEFYRVKSEATSGIGGTGLGLSLVKVVIDNHGGRVWFESEEGVGSTFFVELPLLKESQHN